MKIASAYARVSDDRQAEYSPASQIKLIKEYAKKNDYLIPDKFIFCDEGISGKTVSKRTQFQEMIAHAKNKDFDTIFVWKFSRFARNQEESILYKNLLKKYGVNVVSISEPITDEPFGSLIERIIEWMDEFYVIRLAGEVKRGMIEKASRGEPVTVPPFGYSLEDNKYIPNADADAVREVFAAHANGMGLRQIALMLASKGIVTRFGNPPDNRFVEYLLNNHVYIGKIRWSSDGRTVSRRDYNNENILIYDGNHEPLISQELWDTTQEIIKARKLRYGKYQRREQPVKFMLKGLVRCSSCGATLVYISTKSPALQCHNYARGACKVSHCVVLHKITKAVVEALKASVEGVSFIIERKEVSIEIDYSKLIEAEQRKLDRIKSAYVNGIDTIEEYTAYKESIMKTIEGYKTKTEVKDTPADFGAKVREIVEFIQSDASEEDKNEALRTIISKIVYDKASDNIDIHYYI